MAPPPSSGSSAALKGVLFLAAVDAAYNAYGAINSSPQTTELFAAQRERTLMKYVYTAGGISILLGFLGSWLSRSVWPLLGAGLVVGMMHGLYRHAARCGRETPSVPAGSSASPARASSATAAQTLYDRP